ncbi:type I-E CRISPR-associated protein Cas7/Cse4/CasC [Nocardioides sp.]|uniref:type I-E CRISPR-associated protein Cas7/Cse4/CasC n=1 Tax=Nocardioides sp. TaxID=35761 RepID=UPI00262E1CE1|nr:type I-E CRISPR-associated protein Cas7/Cse4/CasC [Nocardioides sp.]
MTTFLDLHILQTVPSSNLNRDDTGSPKTATFGGVKRARVSSQAWKRATRRDFGSYLDSSDRGVRTRRIMADLVGRIRDLDSSLDTETALGLAKDVMAAAAGIKFEKPKRGKSTDEASTEIDLDLSSYLVFISNQQLARLAELALTGRDGTTIDKAAAKDALKDGNGIDVALFGRMIADAPAYNVDAAVQVAHAISTHAVETEYDYFTAVDDAKTDEEDAGAGMIGVIEFNSSTLYRYATINVDQLEENLGDVDTTVRAVEAFVQSFIESMPSGKQNTFANGTLPDAVVLQVRDRAPINLAGAFESPVLRQQGEAISTTSARELAKRSHDIEASFGKTPAASYLVSGNAAIAKELDGLGEPVSLADLVTAAGERAREALQESA